MQLQLNACINNKPYATYVRTYMFYEFILLVIIGYKIKNVYSLYLNRP